MSKSTILLFSLIAFIVGIALHQFIPFAPEILRKILIVLPILIVFSKILKLPKLLTLFLILPFAFYIGTWRGQSTIHLPSPSTIDYYTSDSSFETAGTRKGVKKEERNSVTIIGTIAEEPDVRRDKINYTIEVKSLSTPIVPNGPNVPNVPVTGHTLISTGKYPKYEYGDTLKITGHLQRPTQFDSFDYAGYLSRYGIFSVMYRPRVKLLVNPSEATASLPSHKRERTRVRWKQQALGLLLNIKQLFESQMNRTFSTEPSSSFMAGLLLGSRKGIPEELSEDFRITGLTHIIAISGYNITLIVTILMSLFRPLGKKTSILISAIGVILFTIFVGASPAVVRACIMGLIALLALNSDRKGDITLTLVLTASIMIGYNPKILFHDVGFQLSFLATMGLIYVSPLIEPYFRWLPKQLAIRESVLLTISAQIMALPIIVFNFQNLSIVSPLSNLLIAGPIIPFAMLFGFLGTIVSFLYLPLAKLLAFPAYLLLEYIVSITKLTAKIPYANVDITWFSKPLFFFYFIILTTLLLFYWKNLNNRLKRISAYQLTYQHLISQHLIS